uniref:Uncharacterized protein n=1 Tax=Arundo donax TaxID=35708 RepID=A0A0A9B2R8_ARUDO
MAALVDGLARVRQELDGAAATAALAVCANKLYAGDNLHARAVDQGCHQVPGQRWWPSRRGAGEPG